jgi:hypothetical protein
VISRWRRISLAFPEKSNQLKAANTFNVPTTMTMKNLTAVASFFLLALTVDVHAQMPQPAPVRIESGMA